MHLIFCFLGFLSLSLFGTSKKYAEESYDVPMIFSKNIGVVTTWFFLTGIILPLIILFIYERWYFAIIYAIIMVTLSNVIAEFYVYRVLNKVNAIPPFIISILALIFFALMFV